MRVRTGMLAALLALSVCAPPMEVQQSVQGAWTFVEVRGEADGSPWEIPAEVKQPSVIIFTDGYYSIAGVGGVAPREPMPEGAIRATLTPEQAAAIWIPYTSNSGRYEVSGSTIITRPIVALLPNSMAEGTEFVYEFEWDGEELMLTERSEDGWATGRLRRLN